MTAAVFGLAGTLLLVIGGLVTTVLTRKPNVVETQVANDGHWERITGGWESQAKFLRTELTSVQGRVTEMQGAVGMLQESQQRDAHWKSLAIGYIRTILAWGHDAGAIDPPDPPPELVLPHDSPAHQEGPSA